MVSNYCTEEGGFSGMRFRINEGGGSLINSEENSRMFRIDEGRSRIYIREAEGRRRIPIF